jgi:hypothetical protein
MATALWRRGHACQTRKGLTWSRLRESNPAHVQYEKRGTALGGRYLHR